MEIMRSEEARELTNTLRRRAVLRDINDAAERGYYRAPTLNLRLSLSEIDYLKSLGYKFSTDIHGGIKILW